MEVTTKGRSTGVFQAAPGRLEWRPSGKGVARVRMKYDPEEWRRSAIGFSED